MVLEFKIIRKTKQCLKREIFGCCNACKLPSTTQVESTELIEHLEVTVSWFQGYQMKILCVGEQLLEAG